jgi:hypothetical protein
MEGTKKNPDKLNTIGIITVGGVGAALVYLSIVGLQAFYVGETSVVDEVRHFGDQGKVRDSLKSEQVGHNSDFVRKPALVAGGPGMVTIGIDAAKALIVRDAKVDPSNLIPAVGKSEVSTIQPVFGRPIPLAAAPITPVPPPTDGSVPGAVPPPGDTTATPPDGAQPGTEAQPAPVPGSTGTTTPSGATTPTTPPTGAATPGAATPGAAPPPAAGSAAPPATDPTRPATPPTRPATPPTRPATPPAAGAHQ